jgi:hypothetical protein
MNPTRSIRWFAAAATVALVGCALAWADDAPRPDAVADDVSRPQILILAAKGGPPAPIEVPRPIVVKPIGDLKNGGNLWGNFSSAFSGSMNGAAGASTTQIESSLESVAHKLR